MYRGSAVRSAVLIPAILAVFIGSGLSAFAQIAGVQARVVAIQHQATGDRIRVVVHFDRPVRFVEGTAVDPYRIFFDLQGTRPAGALGLSTAIGDPILRRIRVAQYQPGITRVVLDMNRPAPYSAAFLSDPPRLVIEILHTVGLAQTSVVAVPVPTPTAASAPPNQGKPSESVVTPPAIVAPPAAKAPAGSLAPSDSKLASRFGAATLGDASTLLQAAQHGDPHAQFQMGDLYMNGHGVGRDPAAAATWYRAAAQQGDAVAASNLGVLYASGRGVPQSDAEAVNWFRKAADAGDAGGENNLGSMYIAGRGVEQSDVLGAKWLLSAAQHGVPEAQYALGTLYANGRGVPQDDAEAVKWLQAAAAQGYAPAQLALGKMYAAGAGVPRDYAQAMRYFRGANAPEAWYHLGLLYQQGLGAPASDAEAVVWWLKAAERGSAEAQYAIGHLYLNRDPVAAYSWFALAAASGDKEGIAAMKSLAPRLTAQQLAEAQQRARDLAQSRR
jgi:TPR repeat protein